MTRRELIALLGSAAATWPLVVRAQQPASMPLVAMLIGADTVETDGTLAAFLDGLQQLGWTKGRNVRIELRRGEGDAERIRKHAAELAHLAPNVILASGTVTMGPLLQATQTLPIVFVNVTDPVGAGFVQSLSRPGGNTTGFIQFDYSLSGKWVELLKEIAPRVTRAAVRASLP